MRERDVLIVSPAAYAAVKRLLAKRVDADELGLVQGGEVRPEPVIEQRRMIPRTTGEMLGRGFDARLVASGDVILDDGEVWGHWRRRP